MPASTQSQPEDPNALGGVDLTRYWHLLLHQSWVLVLTIIMAGAGAAVYLAKAPKVYASTATIEVEQEARKVTAFQQITASEFRTSEALKTVEQSLLTWSLILRVIQENGLATDPKFAPPKPGGIAYAETELVQLFERKLSVTLRRGTRLIDIIVEDENAEQARRLAQSVVNLFLSEGLDQKLRVARVASSALQKEADELKLKVERSERNLQEYREKFKAVSLEDKQNIIVDKLKDLNIKVTAAKESRLKLESDMAIIREGGAEAPERLLMLSAIASLPEVEGLRKQIQEKETEFSLLKERYLELHPKYIQADIQLKELEQSLRRVTIKAGEKLAHSYAAAKAVEQALAEALMEQEKLSIELHAISIPYNVLSREVESDRALYASVLNRMKETNVAKELESSNIRILDSPMVAVEPLRPKPRKIMLLALLAGSLTGIALIIGFDTLNGAIRSLEDVESGLGLPVLAAIPIGKPAPAKADNVVHGMPNSSLADAFRFLRTSIALLGKQAEHRVVLFTSSVPGEGKTFCAINYAASLAQQGLRTLLIDADLRCPRLSRVMTGQDGPNANVCLVGGLSGYLSGSTSLASACQSTQFQNLTLLNAGRRAPNPSELLGSRGFQELIQEASQSFDRIVIDASPVNVVSDALILSSSAQSICLVIRANSTSRRAVFRALGLIGRTGRKPDGVILNRMKARKKAPRGYEYYGDDDSVLNPEAAGGR
jgi:capsular exopolysaccharide synthesis family protein